MNENDRMILEDALFCIDKLRADPNFTVSFSQYELFVRVENDIQTVLKHIEGVYVEGIPPHFSELLTLKNFRNAVDSGTFTDHDGFGKPAKRIGNGLRMAKSYVRPSSWEKDIFYDTTYIVWFSK